MPRIVVVGSINMDIVVRVPRFPAPGETLAGQEMRTIPGGKGANQAVAAAQLGAQVAMVGRVGDDSLGGQLAAQLQDGGITTDGVQASGGVSSGVALIMVDEHGENNIVIVAGANGTLAPADVDAAEAVIAAADVLLLQLEIPLATVQHAAQLAHDNGVLVVLNAAPAQPLAPELLALVDHLLVNEHEAALLSGGDAAQPLAMAQQLRAGGPANVVITLGERGALCVGTGGSSLVPSFKVRVVDTTAAGDAFVAAYAIAIAEGRSPANALRRANATGALAVTRLGAQTSLPTLNELEAFLRGEFTTEGEDF